MSSSENLQAFHISHLAPDFFHCTDFPQTLNRTQLARIGKPNLVALADYLSKTDDKLHSRINYLQTDIDQLDAMPEAEILERASAGCTWHTPDITSTDEPTKLTPTIIAALRKRSKICNFGRSVAKLCKPRECICEDPKHLSCGKTCQICLDAAPFATEHCIFLEDPLGKADELIGEMLAEQARFTEFRERLKIYRTDVRAALELAQPLPPFVGWRDSRYYKYGMEVIYASSPSVALASQVQFRHVRLTCCSRSKSDPTTRILSMKALDRGNDPLSQNFVTDQLYRVLSLADSDYLRSHPKYAQIWLENYTWDAPDPSAQAERHYLQEAMRSYLLGQ